MVIFLALLAVLGKFAWKPILGALEARERRIQDILDAAARDREEAERLMEEHRRQLAEARQQAQQITAEGRQAADRIRQEMLERARAEQEELLARARQELERERSVRSRRCAGMPWTSRSPLRRSWSRSGSAARTTGVSSTSTWTASAPAVRAWRSAE